MYSEFWVSFEKKAYQESSDLMIHTFHKPDKTKPTWDTPDYLPQADAVDMSHDGYTVTTPGDYRPSGL